MTRPRLHSAPRRPVAAALAACLVSLACLAAGPGQARAQTWKDTEAPAVVPNVTPPELEGVDVVEHLGAALPRAAAFRDSDGKAVKLGDYFDGKRPTLFVFAYHTCPMLCSLVLDATIRSLNAIAWTVGEQFDVVSISIDPKDTPETATRKRAQVVGTYARAHGDPKGFHFLVGAEDQIRLVTEAVGFKYRYDVRQKQYAHPAAIYLLTPEGALARYLYGIQYPPGDIRLGLLEASEGRSISTTDRVLLFCYHYDPQGKKYALVAMNVMRLGGAVTLVLLGGLLAIMWLRERRKTRRDRATAASAAQHTAGAHPS